MPGLRRLLVPVCLLAGAASCESAQETGGLIATSSAPPPVEPPPPSAPPPPPAPAPRPPRIVEPPRARMELASLISDADYPDSALVNREQGRVGFALNVLANGRVGGCVVTRSSGSAALDNATCSILVRRARFTPARDSDGNPAADRVSGSLTWTLPDRHEADN